MTDNLPDVPLGGTLKAIGEATTPAERQKLQVAAMAKVDDSRFPKPVPRWVAELPYAGDDSEVQERIAAALLVAEDPDQAQMDGGTEASKALIGRKVTVWDLRTAASRKEGGVGAFLILDVTFGDTDLHQVVTTGAIQAMSRLARAWADDDLPVTGSFAAVPGQEQRENVPITFLVEKAF